MTYQLDLKRHLASYKRSTLAIEEDGVFRYRGHDIACEHVLPLDRAFDNLLPAALEPARAFLTKNPNKRHRYFHHLNSSQAFTFNLFFPHFDGGPVASAALLRALGQDAPLLDWQPEAIPVREEGTNLDATWATSDGTRTFCEVKLSEYDLGKAKEDEKHRKKLRDIYRPILEGHLAPELLVAPQFFESYQFVRNVWYVARTPNSRLIFIAPRSNRAVWGALGALIPKVAAPLQARVVRIATEDVLSTLSKDERSSAELRQHAAALARKYVPVGAT